MSVVNVTQKRMFWMCVQVVANKAGANSEYNKRVVQCRLAAQVSYGVCYHIHVCCLWVVCHVGDCLCAWSAMARQTQAV